MKTSVKLSSFIVILIVAASARAQTENNKCSGSMRKAHYVATVQRLHWVSKAGGDYELKTETACKQEGEFDEGDLNMSGCSYPVLAKCPIQLDNEMHVATISGFVHRGREGDQMVKVFEGSYHTDRNLGEVKTGEAGSASFETPDLSTKSIFLNLQSKLDSANPHVPLRDAIAVLIKYEDAGAY